ncbi:sensor histidine kinase [Idiomarina xiamenensis]|uniref:Signal protein n=1 Tax=Idiomarina xiamenensis 10-D-4 TaxID=740709 RepID=K2KX33_9GAMM|nr:histidine kinase [Idiomarina xiamenensis]EKE87059.1 signal protein [Idiomarina xiamenensis 10-D-4]
MTVSTEQPAYFNKIAWAYLVNLGFYIVPMFYFYYPWQQQLLMTLALLAFVACYFCAYQVQRRYIHWPVLAMLIIAFVSAPINPGAIAMFGYVGFFLGFAYRASIAIGCLMATLALLWLNQWLWPSHWDQFLVYGVMLTIGISFLGRIERLRQQQRQQEQQSQEEISRLARHLERERIARDLHDILGHTLSTVILKTDLANQLLAHQQVDGARQQLSELSQLARQSLAQLRDSVSGFRHQGLAVELKQLQQRLQEAGFSCDIRGQLSALSQHDETQIILMLTELTTNIIRHSNGQHCEIVLDSDNRQHHIWVRDDGQMTSAVVSTSGNGLQGIKERVAALNGSFQVAEQKTTPGFQAQLQIPIAKEASA